MDSRKALASFSSVANRHFQNVLTKTPMPDLHLRLSFDFQPLQELGFVLLEFVRRPVVLAEDFDFRAPPLGAGLGDDVPAHPPFRNCVFAFPKLLESLVQPSGSGDGILSGRKSSWQETHLEVLDGRRHGMCLEGERVDDTERWTCAAQCLHDSPSIMTPIIRVGWTYPEEIRIRRPARNDRIPISKYDTGLDEIIKQ